MSAFIDRLREPSTAASIGGIMILLGFNVDEATQMGIKEAVIGVAALAAFLLGMFKKEGRNE